MSKLDRIISDLEQMKLRPNLFVNPVTPELMFCFFNGLGRGIILSDESLVFDNWVMARRAANRSRGWEDRSTSPYREMREKGIPEDEIIQELVEIEIKMWRILFEEDTGFYE